MRVLWAWVAVVLISTGCAVAQDDLVIVENGATDAIVVVRPDLEDAQDAWETKAASDLVKYIGMMSGARPALADPPDAIRAALKSKAPLLIVGEQALKERPRLKRALRKVVKKAPHLRADAIVLERRGNRVYLAGINDSSHYYAVAELLRRWGCRWFIPTEFGECIPDQPTLTVGDLDYAYGPPFEIRTYWISWVGDGSGAREFRQRNMMTARVAMPPTGHALGKYTRSAPGSKGSFNFPITKPETARHVAEQVEGMFAKGESFSLGMQDGSYDSDYTHDQELMKLQWDKYFMRWSVTDPMLELYNNVARILQEKHPKSSAKMGFLAYANMTIPPVRDMTAERSLFCELAPIDIDPIHGMDAPQSPPRQEYKEFMYEWAKVMGGRMAIYDYDQGMLVWRDIPNPSHQSFAQDVKHYRNAGILGVNTESRNAIATTFINLYMRGRLMWNPDEDVDALLADFYERFYGPAAAPMADYWNAIFDAWERTICTEHEHFVAPAIYTRELVAKLRNKLEEAEQITNGIKVQGRELTRNEKRYLDRMRFTRLSFEIIRGYLTMVWAAATDVDYKTAVEAGERTLAVREELTDMSGIFTTYRRYKVEHKGYAWWPGEIKHCRELLALTDGTNGELVAKLPVEWTFHRDLEGKGVELGYHAKPVDLAHWNQHKGEYDLDSLKDYPVDRWEMLRSDLYMQAQGVRHPDRQSFVGHAWYRTDVELTTEQAAGKVHVMFPGLFNKARLYVNGEEVAQRKFPTMWWLSDYKFEWDVELAGKLKAGVNTLALVVNCEHHFGGMFRRPFLYIPAE